MRIRDALVCQVALVICLSSASGAQLHVAKSGSDDNKGSLSKPLLTISRAAELAQPGDVITVHEGIYRERITPARGGSSDSQRIVYQAADGESVNIKGSEVISGWVKTDTPGVWTVTLSNDLFGKYNPYRDVIEGDWFEDKGRPHHTGDIYLNGKSLYEMESLAKVIDPKPLSDIRDSEGSIYTWYCESDEAWTKLFANFHSYDPNAELVEANVRESCFYPAAPGIDYLTIRGFRFAHAATQWAAPTAEQIGLIGTHWSKGWIIENNVISDSRCSGITLGKDRATGHNVWTNEPSKDGATHYNEVVDRALAANWDKASIGSHVIRNNTIFDCEQTGICGSLGAVFSTIENNHIYNIWKKRQFTGAEMGGIKLHAAIDVLIKRNRIHHCGRGLWMDWMAQGTRIASNLIYDNTTDDLFVEVNHGPFLVENNIMLSPLSIRDWSEGGAYVHNLFAGVIESRPELGRVTPYHLAHSTRVVERRNIEGGDNRFFNNLFIKVAKSGETGNRGFGLAVYDSRRQATLAAGNVYLGGAKPSKNEADALINDGNPLMIELTEDGTTATLKLNIPEIQLNNTQTITSEILGVTQVSKLGWDQPDGTPFRIDRDYFGHDRDSSHPTTGPIESLRAGTSTFSVW